LGAIDTIGLWPELCLW